MISRLKWAYTIWNCRIFRHRKIQKFQHKARKKQFKSRRIAHQHKTIGSPFILHHHKALNDGTQVYPIRLTIPSHSPLQMFGPSNNQKNLLSPIRKVKLGKLSDMKARKKIQKALEKFRFVPYIPTPPAQQPKHLIVRYTDDSPASTTVDSTNPQDERFLGLSRQCSNFLGTITKLLNNLEPFWTNLIRPT